MCSASIDSDDSDPVFSLTPTVRSFGGGTTPVAELVVPIRQTVVESLNVDQIAVVSGTEVQYWMPVGPDDDLVGATNRYNADDVIEYGQSLGHVPQSGMYRIVAQNGDGEALDEVRIEFRCYRVLEEGPA